MSKEKKYAAENLRPKFREFLEKTYTADIDGFMAYAETELPQVLRIYFNVQCNEVYELRDRRMLQDARSRVQTDPALREVNDASGSRLSQVLRKYADFLQSKYFQEKFPTKKKPKHIPPPAQKPQPRELTEGAKKHVESERAWRNPQLRAQCLDYYGYQCQCCGIEFDKIYGETGNKFIEVHHLRPISSYDDEHKLDPLKELIPLCSNCHSMIHHLKDDEMTLKKLREIYNGPKWKITVKIED